MVKTKGWLDTPPWTCPQRRKPLHTAVTLSATPGVAFFLPPNLFAEDDDGRSMGDAKFQSIVPSLLLGGVSVASQCGQNLLENLGVMAGCGGIRELMVGFANWEVSSVGCLGTSVLFGKNWSVTKPQLVNSDNPAVSTGSLMGELLKANQERRP